ncbi:MAG: hypothetical protein IT454_22175 [Planctomycetes bacterium]|nr:hypothetical protein [Planctomycetota bacterium]
MNERTRIAFITGCMFVIGMHVKTAGRMLIVGWLGPYADQPVVENVDVTARTADTLVRAESVEARVLGETSR